MAKKIKLPSDFNKRAKAIVDALTSDNKDTPSQEDLMKMAASAFGRKGGKAGGPARAKALTAKRRSEIAKKAAKARWHKK